jgi:hypothetical protein
MQNVKQRFFRPLGARDSDPDLSAHRNSNVVWVNTKEGVRIFRKEMTYVSEAKRWMNAPSLIA